MLDVPACKGLLVNAAIRPRQEIDSLRNRLFTLHWRLTDYYVRPKVIDFAEFARTASFGPLDISGLTLIGGDLAIEGARLDRATHEALSTTRSATHERHISINWLSAGPDRYSHASVDT